MCISGRAYCVTNFDPYPHSDANPDPKATNGDADPDPNLDLDTDRPIAESCARPAALPPTSCSAISFRASDEGEL